MRLEIKKLLQKVGVTSIFVTHDQVEAMTLADRLAVINNGIIEQLGTPIEIYDNPISLFVAGFIGSPQMNFLDADLKNVTKIYPNGTKAVHETSLSIDEGEFMVFVGPSGCGKSTLLRMVAGLEDITEGDINLDGKLMNEVDPSERDVAMVFQNYALYPHMNVYYNLAYGLKNRGIDKETIDQKVNDAAKLLQISDYLQRKPSM